MQIDHNSQLVIEVGGRNDSFKLPQSVNKLASLI